MRTEEDILICVQLEWEIPGTDRMVETFREERAGILQFEWDKITIKRGTEANE